MMFRNCRKLWLAIALVGVSVVFAFPAWGNVDLELTLTTEANVVNGNPVNVAVYAVSDSPGDQDVGRIELVFTWDNAALELLGYDDAGNWWNSSFPIGGLNATWDDGDALFRVFDLEPVAVPPDPGLLVTTLQFLAIDTATNADVTIEVNVGSVYTVVLDDLDGNDVTGVFLNNPVTVTIYCDTTADCGDGNDCTDDECHDGGEPTGWCSHTPVLEGTTCGDQTVEDCNDADTCDAVGNCLSNYWPEFTACGSEDDTECDNPDTCDGAGTCLSNYEPEETPCGSGDDTECDNPDTCDGAGTCLPNYEPAQTSCGSPDDTECDDPDSCDGLGTCQYNWEPNGTMCTDDGIDCTADECYDGECTHPYKPEDAPCGDPTDDDCTDPDACDGAGVCLPNDYPEVCYYGGDPVEPVAYCETTDDCGPDETCEPYECPPETPYCVDSPSYPSCVECVVDIHCDDGNECTYDWCSPAGYLCQNSSTLMDGEPCTSDELYCNGEEICDQGSCIHPGSPCDDGNCCTDDFCYEGTDECENVCNEANDCDDGVYCNGVDECDDTGEDCVLVQPGDVNCDVLPWEDDCNDGFCDEDLDSCDSVPINEGGLCEDGDACTGYRSEVTDMCNAYGVCIPGDRPSGIDYVNLVWVFVSERGFVLLGEPFAVELWAVSEYWHPPDGDLIALIDVVLSWDPEKIQLLSEDDTGAHEWYASLFPDDSNQDGLNNPYDLWQCDVSGTWCETTEDCPPGETCIWGVPDNDGEAYYTAFSSLLGYCEVSGNSCDGDEDCDPGEACILSERAYATPDGLLVTTFHFGTLAEAIDGTDLEILDCVGDFPTASDINQNPYHLQGTFGSITIMIGECMTAADCNDEIDCTIDTCSVDNDCVHTPDHAYCDDDLYCNGNDLCNPDAPPGTGCIIEPGSVPNCDDGTVCSNDWCDEVDDVCAHDWLPDCVPCDAGEVWPDCDDEIYCTDDWCNYSLGKCRFDINDDLCQDDLFCNGPDACDPEDPEAEPDGCVHGPLPCPPEICDEENDVCVFCEPPIVAAVGSRYISIEPQEVPGAPDTPAAFKVLYCGRTVGKYVGNVVDDWPITTEPGAPLATLGFLVDDPDDAVFRSPAEWGPIVYVTGEDMLPSRPYEVQAHCPGAPLTEAVAVSYKDNTGAEFWSTWDWGDTAKHPNHLPGLEDIMVVVNGFQGNWLPDDPELKPSMPNADIGPAAGLADECVPDQYIGLDDIMLVIAAFQGKTFAQTYCDDPCAP